MKDMNIQKKYPAIKKIKLPGFCKILLFTLLVSLLSACVTDDLYNTSHPDKGAVVVTTRWEKSTKAVNNDGYILEIDGGKISAAKESLVLPGLYVPGMHKLRVYTQPEGITIEGSIISVNKKEGNFLYEPGDMHFAMKDVNVIADDTVYVEVATRQWIKELQLTLNITEGSPERIQTAEGTLEGIVAKADLDKNILLNETGMLKLHFIREGNKLTASLRLLGVSSTAKLMLNLLLTFTDGRTQTVVSDLTDVLKDINESDGSFTIDGELNTPVNTNVTATITDWRVYEESIEIY